MISGEGLLGEMADSLVVPPVPSDAVRLKRSLLAAVMTCPLCNKILDEPTTIPECLHTFCRKCIVEKLNDEEVDCCPTCNIDLGSMPMEKLRPDHILQDVRYKIFPFKRRKVNAPEVRKMSLPVRRKERSISSLVVSPPVGTQTGLTGRTKAAANRAATLGGVSPATNGSSKREDVNPQYCSKNSKSPEILKKIAKKRRQNSSNVEKSYQTSIKDMVKGEPYMDNANLWKSLNCLVEAATVNSTSQSPTKAEPLRVSDTNVHTPKTKDTGHTNKSRVEHNKNGDIPTSSESVKVKSSQGICRKRKKLQTSAQALVDTAAGKHDRRMGPIWFSLVAAADQDRGAPVPQLSTNFLRIKDGSVPASFIQKYLAKKLSLATETEVDIYCQGQPVDPVMPLHALLDMWQQTGSTLKYHAVGSSAKDCVMVLVYRCKSSISSLCSLQ